MNYCIRRSVDIHFAHHLRGHEGACIHIHGHTWKFEVDLAADELNSQGFVVDFSELSQKVLTPCYQLLDHSLAIGRQTYQDIESDLASVGKRLLGTREDASVKSELDARTISLMDAENRFPGGLRVAVFPFSPTSERLAKWLFLVADQRLADDRVRVKAARVYETLHPVESVAEFSA